MFLRDYPRGVVNHRWFRRFPALDALPVAPALPVAFLLAALCGSVLLLCFPPRPLPRFFPAALAAISLVRLPRMKALLAAFQQTRPRPASPTLPPASRLIFARSCSTLERAHGRSCSQKLLPWRGMAPLRGAVDLRLNYKINTVTDDGRAAPCGIDQHDAGSATDRVGHFGKQRWVNARKRRQIRWPQYATAIHARPYSGLKRSPEGCQ